MRLRLTLTRRVCLSLLVALFAVFAVLLIVDVTTTLGSGSGEIDRAMRDSAEGMLDALEHADDDSTANAVVRMFDRLQQRNAEEGQPPISHIILIHRPTGRQLQSKFAPMLGSDTLRAGVHRVMLRSNVYRSVRIDGEQWSVAMLDREDERRRDVVLASIAELAKHIAIALPVLVIPVWLAVRQGMKPLLRLSSLVAERSLVDLSPVPSVGSYAELEPLEQALNSQFQRAARWINREQAFVQNAAHELRTPLAIIATQAHVLATSEGTGRREAQRSLEDAVGRASHLVQQLLALSRADALRQHASALRAIDLDLMDLLRDTLADLAPLANWHGCKLSLDGPAFGPVQADPDLMRSVIINLVDNAVKYGGDGGIVEVTLAYEVDGWTVNVRDRGRVPLDDYRDWAFERFWRSESTSISATGLGLPIVREVLRGLGSTAELRQNPGGGCWARVHWPARATLKP